MTNTERPGCRYLKQPWTEGLTARVLVVDDDGNLRWLLGNLVRSAGHEAVEAANAEQALAVYRKQRTDLVITDMYMPGSDGVDVIMRLRSEFPTARIMAISGGGLMGTESVLEAARRAGAMRTLAKPFELEDLYRAMSESLAQ